MPTRFYLHRGNSSVGGTLPATNSRISATAPTWTPGTTNSVVVTPLLTNHSMDSLISAVAQTSLAYTTDNVTTGQGQPLLRFVSAPLVAQTIAQQAIIVRTGLSQSSTNSALALQCCLAVWRPGTGALVGRIHDGLATGVGSANPGTTQTDVNISIALGNTAAVTVQDDDVLVLELWRGTSAQSMGTSYTNTIFYDGTTEGSTSNNAAYLNFTNNITLAPSYKNLTGTAAGTATAKGAPQPDTYGSMIIGHPNLVGYWRLDDSIAGVAKDSSSGTPTYPGTTVGSPTLGVAGGLNSNDNKAMRFNGTDQYITIGDTYIAGAFSAEAWFKAESWTSAPIICRRDAADGGGYELSFDASGHAQLYIYVGSAWVLAAYTDKTFGLNVWHHIVATYDSAGGGVAYIVVNGMVEATNVGAVGTIKSTGTQMAQIGRNPYWGNVWHGTLDDVALYNTIIDYDIILKHYRIGVASRNTYEATIETTAGLVAYWPINESGGPNAFDESGHGFTLSVGSGVSRSTGIPLAGLYAANYDNTGNSWIRRPIIDPEFDFGTGNFSIELWCKQDTLTIGPLFEYGDTTGHNFHIWQYPDGGTIYINWDGLTGYILQTAGGLLVADTWHHIVAVRNGTAGTVYIDGVSRGAVTFPGGFDLPFTRKIMLGFREVAANEAAHYGLIDQVAVYNVALSPAQITDHFVKGATPELPGKILGAQANGVASVAVALTRKRALIGTSAGRTPTIATVTIGRKRALTATSVGGSTATAAPTRRRPVTGASAGVAADTGQVSKKTRIAAAVSAAGVGVASGVIAVKPKPIAILTDNFNDGTIGAQWEIGLLSETDWTGGTVTVVETGGTLQITPTTINYNGIRSVVAYDLTGGSVTVKFFRPTAFDGPYGGYGGLVVGTGDTHYAAIVAGNANGLWVNVDGDTYPTGGDGSGVNPGNWQWWRISESGGTLDFQTSTDGTTWTDFHMNYTPTFDVTAVRVGLQAGRWDSSEGQFTGLFDDLNVAVVTYKDLAGSAAGIASIGVGGGPAFSDNFNRADGELGGNWVEDPAGDTASIISNQARLNDFGTRWVINTTATGTPDYAVQAELTQGSLSLGGAIGLGITARYQDANNFYLLWDDQGATAFILYKCVGGGFIELNRYTFGSPNADPVTLKLSCQGDQIKGYVNGIERVSATDSAHTAAGAFGLRGFNPGDANTLNHRWDNFQVLVAGAGGITQINAKRAIAGASAGGSTASGQTLRKRALVAASAGVATDVGQVAAKRLVRIPATSVGGSTATAQVRVKRLLGTYTSVGGSTASGVVTRAPQAKNITGSAAGTSTAAATIRRKIAIAGISTSISTATGQLVATRRLVAASAGVATATATTTRRRPVTGASVGSSTVTGQTTRKIALIASTAIGAATVTATISKGTAFKAITGSASGLSTASATATRRRPVTGVSAGVSTTTAQPARKRALTVSAAGSSTATGLILRKRALVATSVGITSASATPTAKRVITGTSTGLALTNGVVQKLGAVVFAAQRAQGTAQEFVAEIKAGAVFGAALMAATAQKLTAGTATGATFSAGLLSATTQKQIASIYTGTGFQAALASATAQAQITQFRTGVTFPSVLATASAQELVGVLAAGTKFNAVQATASLSSYIGSLQVGLGFQAQLMQVTTSAYTSTLRSGVVLPAQLASASTQSQSAVMRTSNGFTAAVAFGNAASFAVVMTAGVRITAQLMSATVQSLPMSMGATALFIAQRMQATADLKIVTVALGNLWQAQTMLVNARSFELAHVTGAVWTLQTAVVNGQLRIAVIRESFGITSPGPDIIYAENVVPIIIGSDELVPYIYSSAEPIPAIVNGEYPVPVLYAKDKRVPNIVESAEV